MPFTESLVRSGARHFPQRLLAKRIRGHDCVIAGIIFTGRTVQMVGGAIHVQHLAARRCDRGVA